MTSLRGVIRWLALILLVLSIHPPGFPGPGASSGRGTNSLAAWSLAASDVEGRVPDWSVDAYDDDDRDDSVPAQPGRTPSGSDDDVMCAGVDGRIPSGMVRPLPSPLAGEGLRPARGHSPDTERPPRSA